MVALLVVLPNLLEHQPQMLLVEGAVITLLVERGQELLVLDFLGVMVVLVPLMVVVVEVEHILLAVVGVVLVGVLVV
jgi:hypothetical protein